MLSGLVTFLLAIIILLAIPVTVQFDLSWRETLKGQIKLIWLFGLVRIRLSPSPHNKPTAGEKERVQRSKLTEHPSDGKSNLFAGIRYKAFRRRIMRYLRDCWHAMQKKDLTLHGRLGMGDPADTGQLWAILGPIAALLSNVRSATIHLEPEFNHATLELDSRGVISLMPLQLIYLTLGLFLSPPVWHGIRLIRGTV